MSLEEFEIYLREFEPRKPGALRQPPETWSQWRRLAAAAVILLATGISTWIAQTRSPHKTKHPAFVRPVIAPAAIPSRDAQRNQVTLGELRRLAESEQLETVLANASRRELPDFREKTSALRFLAKE